MWMTLLQILPRRKKRKVFISCHFIPFFVLLHTIIRTTQFYLKKEIQQYWSVMRCPFSFLTLQMTLQKHAFTLTGLHGLPAAQPLVKRASGWGRGCWRPSWTSVFPAHTLRILSPVWGLDAVMRVGMPLMSKCYWKP